MLKEYAQRIDEISPGGPQWTITATFTNPTRIQTRAVSIWALPALAHEHLVAQSQVVLRLGRILMKVGCERLPY